MEDNIEEVMAFATRSEKVLDYINSALINTIFVSFTIWWSLRNSNTRYTSKRGLKSLALLLYFVSVFSEMLSDWLVVYLSAKIDVNKVFAEKLGYLEGAYKQGFGTRQVDLVMLFNVLLTTYQVLKVTTLFLMVSSWMPVSFKKIQQDHHLLISRKELSSDSLRQLSSASVATFSTCYVALRLPLTLLLLKYQGHFSTDTTLFVRSIFFGVEIAICALFLLILKIKYQGIVNSKVDAALNSYSGINIFITMLLSDSFFNHIVNILSIPLTLSETIGYIIDKIGFLSRLIVNVILLTILYPQASKTISHQKYNDMPCKYFLEKEDNAYAEKKAQGTMESDELVDVMSCSPPAIK